MDDLKILDAAHDHAVRLVDCLKEAHEIVAVHYPKESHIAHDLRVLTGYLDEALALLKGATQTVIAMEK